MISPVFFRKSQCYKLVSLIGILVGPQVTMAEECQMDLAGLIETRSNTMEAIASRFKCVISLLETADSEKIAADQRIAALEAELAVTQEALPNGAVVAFDNSDLYLGTCPEGWTPFFEGRGRFIVGAGDTGDSPAKYGFDARGKQLTHYVLRQHGGEEEHVLTQDEMPHHTHGNKSALSGRTLKWNDQENTHPIPTQTQGDDFDWSSGKGTAYNNMPPYIALYYCRKM